MGYLKHDVDCCLSYLALTCPTQVYLSGLVLSTLLYLALTCPTQVYLSGLVLSTLLYLALTGPTRARPATCCSAQFYLSAMILSIKPRAFFFYSLLFIHVLVRSWYIPMFMTVPVATYSNICPYYTKLTIRLKNCLIYNNCNNHQVQYF